MVDRRDDPGEHYPYKHDTVVALLEEDPPAGPDGPDDDRVRMSDYTSRAIADATAAYVEAQVAYEAAPDAGTRGAYHDARDELQAARAAHRANRTAGPVIVGIRARRAGE